MVTKLAVGLNTFLELITVVVVFFILLGIVYFLYIRVKNSPNKYLSPREFLPEDEIHTLRQVFYLIMMALCFINFLYSIIFLGGDVFYYDIFDILLSLFIAIQVIKGSFKGKLLLVFLIPYGSIAFFLFQSSYVEFLDYIHMPVFLYFVKVFYDKFMEYTNSNGLGITIILLFSIVFVSFFITQVVEQVYPLDALVMVSNAFTSNGYAVLGNSTLGKVNSIFLVWGGYIISGAATATLTATILLKYFNKRIRTLEKLLEDKGDNDD